MTDLYRRLGLPKSASATEIRKAYRKMAKRLHPDRPTGSVDKFNALKLAHDVLLNPARRAFYDATGKIKPDDIDQGRGSVIALVASALTFCVQAALKNSVDLKSEDLVDALVSVLKKKLSELEAHEQSLQSQRKVWAELAGRFHGKDGDNVIDGIITGTLSAMEGELHMQNAAKANCEAALKLVKSHTFRRDVRNQAFGRQYYLQALAGGFFSTNMTG